MVRRGSDRLHQRVNQVRSGVIIFPINSYSPHPHIQNDIFPQVGTVQIGGIYIFSHSDFGIILPLIDFFLSFFPLFPLFSPFFILFPLFVPLSSYFFPRVFRRNFYRVFFGITSGIPGLTYIFSFVLDPGGQNSL